MGPLTKKKYEAMWEQFQTWCGTRLRATMNKSRLDILLTEYLEFLYLEGEDLSKANYVAAVLYKVPGTKGSHSLPKTQQSMKGWRRLCPPRHECPCHRSCVPTGDGCFATAPDSDCLDAALDVPPIPSALGTIPDPGARHSGACQVGRKEGVQALCLLHPNEEGVPSKTLQFDEMISLDMKHQSFLGPALEKHLRLNSRNRSEPAFSIDQSELVSFVETHWEPLGLKPLGAPHLYRLRHGGASHDAAMGLRELTSIQSRGRWQTVKSLKNYTKGGRLQQLFKKPRSKRAAPRHSGRSASRSFL